MARRAAATERRQRVRAAVERALAQARGSSAPKYLVFDRDSIFSAEVVGAVKVAGAEPTVVG